MKRNAILIMIITILLTLLIGCKNSTEPEETNDPNPINTKEVSGTWTIADSPYQINEKITIPDGETLTIEPGVKVIFTGHYKFIVKGRLLAIGTEQDTIVFTGEDESKGWHGIKLLDISSSNDSTIFEYCIFQYGKANTGSGSLNRYGGAINSDINKLRISHCLFQNNMTFGDSRPESAGGAIATGAGNSLIEYCEFRANKSTYGAAIVIAGDSPIIRNNHFHNNNGHGTINTVEGASPILINNLIENNIADSHGIIHIGSGSGSVVLINNTIVNNTCFGGSAIFVNDSSPPLCINNIIYGNESSQIDYHVSSTYYFINCLIEGYNAVYPGIYENCLDSNPLFVNSNDFHLQSTSPCINTGVETIEVNGTWYCAPSIDIEGNPRPNPVGSNPDMGTYESEQ